MLMVGISGLCKFLICVTLVTKEMEEFRTLPLVSMLIRMASTGVRSAQGNGRR
jgi:hypothetical protein